MQSFGSLSFALFKRMDKYKENKKCFLLVECPDPHRALTDFLVAKSVAQKHFLEGNINGKILKANQFFKNVHFTYYRHAVGSLGFERFSHLNQPDFLWVPLIFFYTWI